MGDVLMFWERDIEGRIKICFPLGQPCSVSPAAFLTRVSLLLLVNMSSSETLYCGVHQGSVLDPLVYILCV